MNNEIKISYRDQTVTAYRTVEGVLRYRADSLNTKSWKLMCQHLDEIADALELESETAGR